MHRKSVFLDSLFQSNNHGVPRSQPLSLQQMYAYQSLFRGFHRGVVIPCIDSAKDAVDLLEDLLTLCEAAPFANDLGC